MADEVVFDFSDLTQLSRDLGEIPASVVPKLRQAVEFTSFKIKDQWRGNLGTSKSLPRASRAIDYKVASSDGGGQIESQIGAKTGGQGSLVGIVEYGSPTLAPRLYGAKALQENNSDFQRGIEIAVAQAQAEVGL